MLVPPKAMRNPGSMHTLTFQQPPSCYSYPWKLITPFWQLSSYFYLFTYKYLPVSFRVSKHILPKITGIICFFQHLLFLKEIFRRITWPPPSNKKHKAAFHRSHLPSLSIGLLPLGSFGSGQFFLHLFRGRNIWVQFTMFTPQTKWLKPTPKQRFGRWT